MQDITIRFFPLGNADTTLISIDKNRHIIWDFANMKSEDSDDKRCGLPEELNKVVTDSFEIATFTHADNDHIKGFSDYFYLEHAVKYQGADRKKIEELWVPATVLIDTQAEDEAKILKAEARYRLKNKTGIKVFSRPKSMKAWCDNQDDLSYDDVKHLFIDAGQLIPNFTKEEDGFEVFVHAPFMSESQEIDRNGACIVTQFNFDNDENTCLILGADTTQPVWDDIIAVTKHFNNEDRLEWDLFHISHHTSYLSLSDDKGTDKTEPTENIKWLFEGQSRKHGKLISSSKPIPKKGSAEDKDNNPPHRQAAEYYKGIADNLDGEFIVTMEFPSTESPKPYILTITDAGIEESKLTLTTKALRVAVLGIQNQTLKSGKDGRLGNTGMSHKDHKFHG